MDGGREGEREHFECCVCVVLREPKFLSLARHTDGLTQDNKHTILSALTHAEAETLAADFIPSTCVPSYGFGLRATARRSIVW